MVAFFHLLTICNRPRNSHIDQNNIFASKLVLDIYIYELNRSWYSSSVGYYIYNCFRMRELMFVSVNFPNIFSISFARHTVHYTRTHSSVPFLTSSPKTRIYCVCFTSDSFIPLSASLLVALAVFSNRSPLQGDICSCASTNIRCGAYGFKSLKTIANDLRYVSANNRAHVLPLSLSLLFHYVPFVLCVG